MRLWSLLDADGLSSDGHFIILHCNGYLDLVELPRTYSDLQRVVWDLYGTDCLTFDVETDELNVCRGARVKIPMMAWESVAELLGNVFILPRRWEIGDEEYVWEQCLSLEKRNDTSVKPLVLSSSCNVAELEEPLIKNGILTLQLADITFASSFDIRLLDEHSQETLCITIHISTGFGKITLVSDGNTGETETFALGTSRFRHTITVQRQRSAFRLLCDLRFSASVNTQNPLPSTVICCDFGLEVLYKVPIAVHVYPTVSGFAAGFQLYRIAFPAVDREDLYQRFSGRISGNNSELTSELSTIRKEHAAFGSSSTGITWVARRLQPEEQFEVESRSHPRCVVMIRFILTEALSNSGIKELDFSFGNKGVTGSTWLGINITRTQTMGFWARPFHGFWKSLGELDLRDTQISAGEHAIVIIDNGTTFQIFFDYTNATTLPKWVDRSATWFEWRCTKLFGVSFIDPPIVQLEVFDFV